MRADRRRPSSPARSHSAPRSATSCQAGRARELPVQVRRRRPGTPSAASTASTCCRVIAGAERHDRWRSPPCRRRRTTRRSLADTRHRGSSAGARAGRWRRRLHGHASATTCRRGSTRTCSDEAHDVYTGSRRTPTATGRSRSFFNSIGDRHRRGASTHMLSLLRSCAGPACSRSAVVIGYRTGWPARSRDRHAAIFCVGVLGFWDLTMITLALMIVACRDRAADRHPARHLVGPVRPRRAQPAPRARHRAGHAGVRVPHPVRRVLRDPRTRRGRRHSRLRGASRRAPHQPRAAQRAGRDRPRSASRSAAPRGSCCSRCSCRWPGGPILLGLNQVIMMAFGIVVIASLLGTGDVGGQVLAACRRSTSAWRSRRAWRSCSRPSRSTASPPASARRSAGRRSRCELPTGAAVRAGALVARRSSRSLVVATVLSARALPRRGASTSAGWVNDARRLGQRQLPQAACRSSAAPSRSATSSSPTSSSRSATSSCGCRGGWSSRSSPHRVGQQRLAAGHGAVCLLASLHGRHPGGALPQIWDLAMDTLSQVLVAVVISVLHRRAARRLGRAVTIGRAGRCARSSTPPR